MKGTDFNSTGFKVMKVIITEIVGTRALCVDQFHRTYEVPINIQRAKGILPAVGETWMIDKQMGNKWTFSAISNYLPAGDDIPGNIEQDNPVFWWQLADPSETIAPVDSGYGAPGTMPGLGTGTVTGAVTFGVTPVPLGWSTTPAEFSGGYITASAINIPASYSIEVWFSTTVGGHIFFDSIGTIIRVASGQVEFTTNSLTLTSPAATYIDGDWHHVVGVQRSTGAFLYLDGQVVATSTNSPVVLTGYQWQIGDTDYQGGIAHAAYYDYALPRNRVQAHYLAGAP